MAWGSQGMVFLGDDLMHSRDYSEDTARVIDEEVELILRQQEDRCRVVLKEHRGGLDLVAKALLEKETIDGAEVRRLVDQAAGREVRPPLPDAVGVEGSTRPRSPPTATAEPTKRPATKRPATTAPRTRLPSSRAAPTSIGSTRARCTPSHHRITAERPPCLEFPDACLELHDDRLP